MSRTRPLTILCPGTSLSTHPLHKIPTETMGINRSWLYARSSYNLMLDAEQWNFAQRLNAPLSELYTPSHGPDYAHKLTVLHASRPKWSFLTNTVWCSGRSTLFVALQLAYQWKRDPVYLLGLDLHVGLVSGNPQPMEPKKLSRQREVLGYAAGIARMLDWTVLNVNNQHTQCRAFPIVTFKEAFNVE